MGRKVPALSPAGPTDGAAARDGGAVFTPGDLRVAFKRFQADQVTDHAAALTYYALLSLFPALLFGVAVLGFFGEQTLVSDSVQYAEDAGAPAETVGALRAFLQSATQDDGRALGALIVGLGTSLYGASGAFGAVGRALNAIWRVEEGRSFVRKKLSDLLWTLAVLALVLVSLVLVFLGGGLAEEVLGAIGLGDTAAAIWKVARWPGAFLTALLIYAVVYFAAPNVEVRRFQWVTPGALFGVSAWLLASALFFLYVSQFASYGKTYGTFAGAVVLLVWLWLTNIVLLFGAELNAVIRLRRTPELPRSYDGPPLPEKVPAEAG